MGTKNLRVWSIMFTLCKPLVSVCIIEKEWYPIFTAYVFYVIDLLSIKKSCFTFYIDINKF